MERRKGMNLRKPSRPRRKFLGLITLAAISVALLGLASPAPATQVLWYVETDIAECSTNIITGNTSCETVGYMEGKFVADTTTQTITDWDIYVFLPDSSIFNPIRLTPANSITETEPGNGQPKFKAVNTTGRYHWELKIHIGDPTWYPEIGHNNIWTYNEVDCDYHPLIYLTLTDTQLPLPVPLSKVFDGQNHYPINDIYGWAFKAPLANAGMDQTIHVGALVHLNGSGQNGAPWLVNGIYGPPTYKWQIIEKPTGSGATLSNPSVANPTFTADKEGNYKLQLNTYNGLWPSFPSTVTISTSNSAPVAWAGPDQAVLTRNTLVQLNGGTSYDDDGDSLTYFWTITQKPEESAATLDNATSKTPTFIADIEGTYVIGLQVTDQWGATNNPGQGKPTVTISFENVAPVANAGGNQSKVVGDMVTLDGSGSSDANLDPLTYQWTLTSKPEGSSATLAASDATAELLYDLPGDYQVSLVVNDGTVDSPADTITVTVLTKQDAATENLSDTVDLVNSLPPETLPNVFDNSAHANALTNHILAAQRLIDKEQYAEALNKLETDILPKTDGCATQGAPDKNDWIKDCATQEQVYKSVTDTIELLKGLQ